MPHFDFVPVEGFSSNTLRTFPGKLFSLSNTVDSKFWIFSFEFLRQQFVGDNIELKEATVRLKWKPTLNKGQLASQNGQFKVKIFDLIKTGDGFNDCANVDDFHMMQMDIKKVLKSSKDPLSIELDATPAVRRWIKKTKTEHFRILIEKGDLRVKKSARASTTGNGESLAADLEVNEDSLGGMLNFTPKGTFDDVYLKVFSQDHEPKTRMKRAPLKKKIQPPFKGLEGICQLHSYYYDFSLGGWDDWIISPKGFHANLCFGFCPRHMPDHMNSTNNAIIQRLMHDTNPEVFDPPCCVPTEYEPLSLLIIEDEETEKVNVKTFEKMVVTSCGCR